MTVDISLPFPPSVNGLYRNRRQGGRVKTDRYNTWLNAAGWELKRQRPPKVTGRYSITVHVERKDKRRRDLGNLHKGISDLLVMHGVIEDDSLEERVILMWSDTVTGCRVFIEPEMAAA